ncbi:MULTISPECIES: HAD family hydrolase [Aerococcus]|uniref:HAD family hydrolase n=1 Tax=Aerococcus mictus TaxID=2976810 RepID=A0A1E9PL65_9LACT|nr:MULTISPECIES: HAD family hydrolase [Aerococcus]AEA00323.1 HAD hydrolase, family IA, variant 1 [Aerococcus sp. Group 1]KAA9290638.1 HAD family hydrolase [Aerococcus mictus]MBU5610918.1 HAD family hydrolase [Aerococcus urinae]MCY3031489.1 HAD family hydrolase [Aerococcus sp. Group 1]MCY3039792.1 HAD family hydrolase [Aerococcus sp. Group 2]
MTAKKLCLVWDLDDTLYQKSDIFKKANEKFKEVRRDFDPDQLDYQVFKRMSNLAYDRAAQGDYSNQEMWRDRIQLAMKEIGIQISDEEADHWQHLYSQSQATMSLSPKLEQVFYWLIDQGVPLGIITNGLSDRQWQKARYLDLGRWFSSNRIVVSGDIGIEKPDPRIFDYMKQIIGEDYDYWYIGDSYQHDIRGAHAAGWHSIWLNYHQQDQADSQADLSVNDEGQLQAAIENLLK